MSAFPLVCLHLPFLILVHILHVFNLLFILSLQVSDQCHFWGEKFVLQWRWLPDASETGDNSSEQGEEVGEGRTCLWQFLSKVEGKGHKIWGHIIEKNNPLVSSLDLGSKRSRLLKQEQPGLESCLHFLTTLVNQKVVFSMSYIHYG